MGFLRRKPNPGQEKVEKLRNVVTTIIKRDSRVREDKTLLNTRYACFCGPDIDNTCSSNAGSE
jgi:hypothetical protein